MMADVSKDIDVGFPPVLGESPRVLILGTMPSVKSLEETQYYGHPRNAFWWIMSELFGFDSDLPYSKRLLQVKQQGIAIWDVAYSCHRPGSLDSSIDQSTLTANAIPELLRANTGIGLIAFNGQAAAKLFKKFVGELAFSGTMLTLPSTSPANAAMSKDAKLDKWLVVKDYL